MKKLLFLFMFVPLITFAQQRTSGKNYLKTTVPEVGGMVTFQKTFQMAGKTRDQLYSKLSAFTRQLVLQSEDTDVSRITQDDSLSGSLVASIQEMMYFKRKAWDTDCTKFRYQLIFHISDGQYQATIQRISYIYDEERDGAAATYKAEEWITDKYAMNKGKTKLLKLPGKFRIKTLQRIDELFQSAYDAVK